MYIYIRMYVYIHTYTHIKPIIISGRAIRKYVKSTKDIDVMNIAESHDLEEKAHTLPHMNLYVCMYVYIYIHVYMYIIYTQM